MIILRLFGNICKTKEIADGLVEDCIGNNNVMGRLIIKLSEKKEKMKEEKSEREEMSEKERKKKKIKQKILNIDLKIILIGNR